MNKRIQFKRSIQVIGLVTALPLAIASTTDCGTFINTGKTDFLRSLKVNGVAISQLLHQCVQDNFCATYTGSAPCLPTLYNYAADAAYYAGVLQRLSSQTSQISAVSQTATAPQTSQTLQTSTTSPAPSTTVTTTTNTDATPSSSTQSGGLYEDIHF